MLGQDSGPLASVYTAWSGGTGGKVTKWLTVSLAGAADVSDTACRWPVGNRVDIILGLELNPMKPLPRAQL